MKFSSVLGWFAGVMIGVGLGISIGIRLVPVPDEVHVWDLTSPWDRCLAAMEGAELPDWMWECRETPDQPVPATR